MVLEAALDGEEVVVVEDDHGSGKFRVAGRYCG